MGHSPHPFQGGAAGALAAGAMQDQRSVWDVAESQKVIGGGGFGGGLPSDMMGSMQMTIANRGGGGFGEMQRMNEWQTTTVSPALSTPAPAAPVGSGGQFTSLKNLAMSAYRGGGELHTLKSVAGTLRDEFLSMSRFVRRAGAVFRVQGSGFGV